MTDDELVLALAAKVRAVSTAPLGNLEVHAWEMVGSEDPDGSVVVQVAAGIQEHIAIGEQLMDSVDLQIEARIPLAETAASRSKIAAVRKQIVDLLRGNRTLTAGGEDARTNSASAIRWEYGVDSEGDRLKRYCMVAVTYVKKPDDV